MKIANLQLSAKFPSAISWSTDSKKISFQTSGPNGSDIFIYSFVDQTCKTVITDIEPFRLYKDKPDLRWTQDDELLFYAGKNYQHFSESSKINDLYLNAQLIGDLVQLSPDLTWISFLREGDLWIQSIADGSTRQLSFRERLLTEDGQLFNRLSQWPQWSPDSRNIAYLSNMGNGFKIRIVNIFDGQKTDIVPSEDIWGHTIVDWSPDSTMLSISRLSQNFQRKELSIFSLTKKLETLVWADQDNQWVDHNIHPSYDISWSNNCQQIAFLSNKTGWRHCYKLNIENGEIEQITDGKYDCYWCGFSPDDSQLALVTSQGNLQQRNLWVYSLKNKKFHQPYKKLGVCLGGWYLRQMILAWSPDGSKIAHVFSGSGQMPVLLVSDVSGQTDPIEVYQSRPTELSSESVMNLEPVQFLSEDGMTIYGVLATAKNFNKNIKHKALVFCYGAWDQEAQLGWDFPQKNILFNYLTQKGYVILLVDPRGSDGYGNDYAHAQYREGGRKQSDDLVSSARHLTELGYVDPEKIGLFGYSYGGYMVLQTMVRSPGVFKAGISMAPVSEWASYASYSTYTNIRFGSPDENPNPLIQRSPVYQAHKFEGALLIMHGTNDFNVPIKSSEIMVQALIQNGKTFEFMAYPNEGHIWVNPGTIRDSMLRMERFLDTNL